MLATQCSGLLQRSPTFPALQVQPAPAESCAQRPPAQSSSSRLSHGLPTAPFVQMLRKSPLKVSTQCPSLHWSFSAQGCPRGPSVQLPELDPAYDVPQNPL